MCGTFARSFKVVLKAHYPAFHVYPFKKAPLLAAEMKIILFSANTEFNALCEPSR